MKLLLMAFSYSSWAFPKDAVATFFANECFHHSNYFLSHKWITLKTEETLPCTKDKAHTLWTSSRHLALWVLSHILYQPSSRQYLLFSKSSVLSSVVRALLNQPKAKQSVRYVLEIYTDFLKFKQILNGRQLLLWLIWGAKKHFCMI